MPLLTFEGVEVDVPTDLAGVQFAFANGALSIRCDSFTGDIVLSRPSAASSGAVSDSRKRAIDLSASDEDDDDDIVTIATTKRPRPSFLSAVEETMLLAQLDPVSSVASSPQSTIEPRSEADSAAEDVASVKNEEAKPTTASVMTAFLRGDSVKPAAKKTSNPKEIAEAVASVVSPEPKAANSRPTTPGSNPKKRNRSKKKSEEIKTDAKSKISAQPTNIARWETVAPSGSSTEVPIARWGQTVTPISDGRVVLYGGADDDERTLGDLHVFDLRSQSWTRPLNCESVPRTWHDAVYLESKHLLLVFGGERLVYDASAPVDNGEGPSPGSRLDILSDIMVLDTECFLWYPPAIQGTPPSARSGHTCTVLGSDVVVFGGSRGRNRQSSVHVLNSDEWVWRSLTVDGKPPSARTYHSAVAIGDGRVVVFGGNDSHKCFNSVHVLEKSTGTEKRKRRGTKKEKVAGGENDDATTSSGVTSWSWFHPCVVGDPPSARTGHSATLVDENKVLVVGGWDPQSDAGGATVIFSDAFLLDTTSWEWQRVPVEASAGSSEAHHNDADAFSWVFPGRVGHRAVFDKTSGRVLLFGGQNEREERLSVIHALSLDQRTSQTSPTTASVPNA